MSPRLPRAAEWRYLLLDLLFPTSCFACGERLGAVQALGACPSCWSALRPFVGPCGPAGCVAVEYGPQARRFLLRAKFGKRRELFAPLGAMLLAAARAQGWRPTCVVPVPSHPWSSLRRGFQPARELAAVVAAGLGVPAHDAIGRRLLPGAPLKRLSRRRRHALAPHLFRPKKGLSGESVLLVDDLLTTGATLAACEGVCRAAGARVVRSAIWAKAP